MLVTPSDIMAWTLGLASSASSLADAFLVPATLLMMPPPALATSS
jgi:hypothetical protein